MKCLFGTRCLEIGILVASTHAIGTNDQVESDIDYGTFQNPSNNVRPRFRYWVNDASHNLTYVAEDVKALARAGAGGLELLGYYLYGDTGNFGGSVDAIIQSDWTLYGFGGTPWSKLSLPALTNAELCWLSFFGV